MVKSLKRAVQAIVPNRDFTDWELYTAMCAAEDIVNSRPLTFVNADPNDFKVITPSMFITGRMDNQVFPDIIDRQGFDISAGQGGGMFKEPQEISGKDG